MLVIVKQEGSDSLKHYGVKGMKWGQRKSTTSKAPSSEDHLEVSSLRRQETRTLSNRDLKRINERLQLESTYARLSPGKASRGKQFVEGTLATAKLAANIYAVQTNPAFAAALQLGKMAVEFKQSGASGPTPAYAGVPTGSPTKKGK